MPPLLIQVVPRLTPGHCGVSDPALMLAGELKHAFGIDSAFVVLNSNHQYSVPQAAIYCSASELLASCMKLAGGHAGTLLVHVSGYGYSSDGAVTLLADALQKLKATEQFSIAAYFHETFAGGMPWKSAFWRTQRQQRALRKIIAQCELILTNIEHHAEWLEIESQKLCGIRVGRMPVFSTAGETDEPTPFDQRSPVMVMFGLARTRNWAYRQLAGAGDLVNTLGIEEILDVGVECDHPPEINGIPIKRVGFVPTEQLTSVFSRAQFGFVPHPWFCLAKSSIFASYCAYGTIPVLAGDFPEDADGLREGVHVVSRRTADAVRNSGWEACSRAAWTWYRAHRLRVHAERYAKWMGEQQ